MKRIATGLAGIALAGVLSFSGMKPMRAQPPAQAVPPVHTAPDGAVVTPDGAVVGYDSPNWKAPRGYAEAYPENGTPNMVARQGYAAGFTEGQADASVGKKFSPTESRAYAKAVIPRGIDKDQFRQEFREAFVKGYTRGYNNQ